MANSIPELILSKNWRLGYQNTFYDSFDIKNKVRKFANGLKNLGIKKGDFVAILSKNRPEWVIADLAILSLGAVVVTIHLNLDQKTVQYILDDSKPKILMTDSMDHVKDINIKKIEIILCDDIESYFKEGPLTFIPKRSDLATIVYTSGTTGMPKGVMLTHGNLLHNVENTLLPLHNETLLSYLPLTHCFERLAGYYYILSHGSTLIFSQGFHHLEQEFIRIKPTVMTTVPLLLEHIERQFPEWMPKFLVSFLLKKRLGGRLKFFICGGATLNECVEQFFWSEGIPVYKGYGLTETSPVVSVNTPREHRLGSVGKPLKHVQIKIIRKEIYIKGPNVMKGYLHQRKKTNDVIKKDWFATGDIGELKDGFLFVEGRKKHVIVTENGEDISPEFVEAKLRGSKIIHNVMIIGDDRDYLVALVVSKSDRKKIGKDIIRINQTLPSFMRVHDFRVVPVFSIEDNTLSISHKLKRQVIEEKYKDLIEEMYS